MQSEDRNMKAGQQEGVVGDFFTWIGAQMSALWTKAKPTVVADFKLFVDTFEGAALAAVAQEAPKVIDNQEKFDNAAANVTTQVKAAGWTAATAAIETLIQDAYLSYKASSGHSLVTPPPS